MDNLHTGQLSHYFFSEQWPAWGGELGTQIIGFFGLWFFIILKKSLQDVSYDFILSLLEVGHWVGQT